MSKGYEINVDNCTTCPFFERHNASIIADWVMRSAQQTGTCKHAADGRPFPWGRAHVADPMKPPEACPLRGGPTTIKLKVV